MVLISGIIIAYTREDFDLTNIIPILAVLALNNCFSAKTFFSEHCCLRKHLFSAKKVFSAKNMF